MEGWYDSVRLAVFLTILVSMVALETVIPWRGNAERGRRWPSNIGVVILDSVLVRIIFPLSAAGMALVCERHEFGLLRWFGAPGWLAILLSVLALDCLIYGQHVLFHRVPAFWRLHRMHHADTVMDVTTGTRFHPLEIILSTAIKIAAVALLGAPVEGVLIFEILLSSTAMFNHANIRLHPRIEPFVRLVMVTPEMHRVHHSVVRRETDSNFGFNLPWWDHLFGTYRRTPEAGLDGMTIGLAEFRDPAEQRLDRLLTQPFRDPKS